MIYRNLATHVKQFYVTVYICVNNSNVFDKSHSNCAYNMFSCVAIQYFFYIKQLSQFDMFYIKFSSFFLKKNSNIW